MNNLLPNEGELYDYGKVIHRDEATYFHDLLYTTIPWYHDKVYLFGKYIETARKVAWVSDDFISYRYTGVTKSAMSWTPKLLYLKDYIENLAGCSFNSCLLNLYHNGREGVGWHSDNEKALGERPVIASLSLGATRHFVFRHKTTHDTVSITLENGSLLLMRGETQRYWKHSLLKSKEIHTSRISLTFRQILKIS
jgi:alkylated DNA repair dioxygenase AlkB